MQEVSLVPQLSLVKLNTEFKVHSTLFTHSSNLCRVHLFVVYAYVPDKPGRARRSTDNPVRLELPLEFPSLMAVRFLKKIPRGSIWAACPQVHGMESFDVEVAS